MVDWHALSHAIADSVTNACTCDSQQLCSIIDILLATCYDWMLKLYQNRVGNLLLELTKDSRNKQHAHTYGQIKFHYRLNCVSSWIKYSSRASSCYDGQ